MTWNDWAESTYVAPIEPVAPIGGTGRAHVYDERFGNLLSHSAYLDASEYYIQWFKSGSKPAITRDRLFYFYRLNPLGRERQPGPGAPDAGTPPRAQEPLSPQTHVSVFLTAPAVLVVTLAGSATRLDVPADVTHVGSNTRAGTPRFVLQRHGETIIDKVGEQAITDDDFSGAYNYFSCSADAQRGVSGAPVRRRGDRPLQRDFLRDRRGTRRNKPDDSGIAIRGRHQSALRPQGRPHKTRRPARGTRP